LDRLYHLRWQVLANFLFFPTTLIVRYFLSRPTAIVRKQSFLDVRFWPKAALREWRLWTEPVVICMRKTSRNQAFPSNKHDSASAFKLHNPLRPKGYNALRRCLRLLQNPPAYAAMGRGISFACHCKTVIGFGSPLLDSRMTTPYAVSILRLSFYGGHAWGSFVSAGVCYLDRSTNPRMAATHRLVARVTALYFL
jgi:hypothetical protein